MKEDTKKTVAFRDLGSMDYQEAWTYQENLFADIVAKKIQNRNLPEDQQITTPNYLLFVEHPHVYTLGKSGKPEHLLLDENGLASHAATYYKINRGGDITYHGPGQLVGYPIHIAHPAPRNTNTPHRNRKESRHLCADWHSRVWRRHCRPPWPVARHGLGLAQTCL